MCFSSTVSFTAAVALTAISFAMMAKIKRGRFYFLNFIPLFFGIQQFCEGMVWLKGEEFWKNYYLFLAFCFWPIYIPLSFFIAEQDVNRKQGVLICLGIGVTVSLFLFFKIPSFEVVSHAYSLYYSGPEAPQPHWLWAVLYLVATVPPILLSTIKHMWILGVLAFLSAVVITGIDQSIFISMWCFWVAIFSLSLFYILKHQESPSKN